ncbi:MAG: glycosyltransferase [Cyclobacteriaceae bacterium]|nr:glycosyltransferase [Cyclobacteriaceae bacterium]
MSIDTPIISIITPVFNAEKYIALAIHSVLKQTYSNWELLIINDGSTDKSKDIIISFKDERIHYFEQENKGVSAARNIGLQNIKGDYFCFLDADDMLPENSLKDRLDVFINHPEIEFVDGQVRVFNSENHDSTLRLFKPTFKGNPFQALLNLSEACFFGLSWMIKKNSIKKYSFRMGLTHAEDLLFYLSVSKSGIYSHTDSLVYQYRVSGNTAMTNLTKLESGYFKVLEILISDFDISPKQAIDFKSKIKSIMTKSYLSKLQFFKAFKVFTR